MRPINYLPIAITALAINSGSFALADNFSQLLQHKLTIALTQSVEADEVFKGNDNSYSKSVKVIKEKISNKNFLEIFVQEGVIDEITGWSIVVISYDGDEDGFYLVKKGEDNINVSDYFYFDYDNNQIESSSETYKETDTTETTKGKFEESSWGSFGFYLPWDGEEYPIDLYVDGTISYAYEYTYVYDTNDEEFTTEIDNITSISIVNTVGEIEENGNFFALVTGSANIGSGTAIDIVF